MILISHRGNINGKNINQENHPDYVQAALDKEYDVEIIKNEYVLYENINLFPSQPLLKVGEDKIFIKNDDLYNEPKNADFVIENHGENNIFDSAKEIVNFVTNIS